MAERAVGPMSYRALSLLVLGLVFAFLLVLAGAFRFFVRSENDRDLRLAEEHTRAMAQAHEVALQHILDGYRKQLLVLARLIEVEAPPEFLQAKLDAMVAADPKLMDILLLDGAGKVRLWTGSTPAPEVAERPYFSEHLKDHQKKWPLISPPLRSLVHQERWFSSLSLCSRDSAGELLGVSVLIIDLDALPAAFDEDEHFRDGSATLVVADTAGTVLFRLPRTEGATGSVLTVTAAWPGELPRERIRHLVSRFDGKQRILVHRRLLNYPLQISATTDKTALLRAAGRRNRFGGGIYLLILAVSGVATVLLLSGLRSRERQEELLAEKEERLRFLTENMADVVWAMDGDLRYTYCSPSVEGLRGIKVEELLTEPMKNSVTPDYLPIISEQLAATAAGIKSGELQSPVDRRLVVEQPRRDGTTIWSEVAARLFYDGEGRLKKIHGVSRDISQRHRVEQELRRTAAELARSNAELEQFAYAISHDMRQPLRMISGHLQLLERSLAEGLPEEERASLRFAVEGARRLDQMIVGLLFYSRVGRKSDPMALLSAREALEEALLFLGPAISESSAVIRVEGDWPQVVASRDELVRLLLNLIGNAVKYVHPEVVPEVVVVSKVSDEKWRVTIRDNGIGINPDQTERLFKVFSRLQPRSRYEGEGLGLALCRRIIEHHRGAIGVEASGEGRGSSFWFELPLSQPPPKVGNPEPMPDQGSL